MQFYSRFGGTRGGWAFGLSAIFVGDNVPIFFHSNKTVLRTMLMHEKDIGYNLVTRDRDFGVRFHNTIKGNFNDLRPSCRSVNTSAGIEVFSCTFELRKCSEVVEAFKNNFQLRLPEKNIKLEMNLNDVLIENKIECKLNMQVHVDPTIKDEDRRLEIGLVTFARSQYIVFDYE